MNEIGLICEIYVIKNCFYLNDKEWENMSFDLNRINPNQTQVLFHDGRFETLTNEELDELMGQMGISEKSDEMDSTVTD